MYIYAVLSTRNKFWHRSDFPTKQNGNWIHDEKKAISTEDRNVHETIKKNDDIFAQMTSISGRRAQQ